MGGEDRVCRHCWLPLSGVSADHSSYGHAEGNLLRRAPLSHHVVCSKVVQVRLSLPASLIQDYVDDLLPFLTLRCNRSLQEDVLPDLQKRSVVFPALKRDGLDLKDPSNFQPISNVSFLSKIIQKIVSQQITSYLSTNDLLPKYQSGFRRGHSAETLLLRLLSDCYGAIDGGRVTLLALFDVSAQPSTPSTIKFLSIASLSPPSSKDCSFPLGLGRERL